MNLSHATAIGVFRKAGFPIKPYPVDWRTRGAPSPPIGVFPEMLVATDQPNSADPLSLCRYGDRRGGNAALCERIRAQGENSQHEFSPSRRYAAASDRGAGRRRLFVVTAPDLHDTRRVRGGVGRSLARRAALLDPSRRFDISWFVGEVLLVSFFQGSGA
jgi:hypothetical protein